MTDNRITYSRAEDGSWIVYEDGDRLGFVRMIQRGHWVATDTYLVALRGRMKSRDNAVAALLRRKAKENAA